MQKDRSFLDDSALTILLRSMRAWSLQWSAGAALSGVFDSQIAGGKRYDLAVMGRRQANATFFESHGTDTAEQVWFAMDLTPLIQDNALNLVEYVDEKILRFEEEVRGILTKRLGRG